MKELLKNLILRKEKAKQAAHEVLEQHELSESRIIELNKTFEKLENLPIDIAEYFREALQALQVGCYRAAIVLSWAGFIFIFTEYMVLNYSDLLNKRYSKWNTETVQDLLEDVPDYQILEAGKKIGLINNQELNIYKGWLSTRNQSAHPTIYKPNINIALGFVNNLILEVDNYL